MLHPELDSMSHNKTTSRLRSSAAPEQKTLARLSACSSGLRDWGLQPLQFYSNWINIYIVAQAPCPCITLYNKNQAANVNEHPLLNILFSHCWMGAVNAAGHHLSSKNLPPQPHRLPSDILHHRRGRRGRRRSYTCTPSTCLFIPRILYLYLDVRKMKTLRGWDGWAAYLRHEMEMEEVQQRGNGPVPILHHTHTHTHSLGHAAQPVC